MEKDLACKRDCPFVNAEGRRNCGSNIVYMYQPCAGQASLLCANLSDKYPGLTTYITASSESVDVYMSAMDEALPLGEGGSWKNWIKVGEIKDGVFISP